LTILETIPLASDVPKTDEKKSPKTVEPADRYFPSSSLALF